MQEIPIRFSRQTLRRIFPFYILNDKDMNLLALGNSLAKIVSFSPGTPFGEVFSIVRPRIETISFDSVNDSREQLFIIRTIGKEPLTLRGQFEIIDDGEHAVFIGSPWFNSLSQLSDFGLTLNDFAKHDPLVDLLHLLRSEELSKQEISQLLERVSMQKEELTHAKMMAEASSRAKESFMANMSHEIRTPMNAILGLSKQLKKTKMDCTQKKYLNAINSAADNLLVIINDILDFSRIESGKLALEEIGFSLNLLIKKAVTVIRHKAEAKGVAFNFSIDGKLPPILIGDPYRITQILMNLLGNSVKFTENGSISLECNEAGRSGNEIRMQIVVRDTGIGMDQDFLKNLFEKFSQEDTSISRKYGGTGLGMSITSQLVRLMNGNIRVESVKNVGTAFYIEIPFKEGQESDLPKADRSELPVDILSGLKMLLVEDNLFNRMVASVILKRYGVELTETDNGRKAVNLLQSGNFDLVLLDLQMPVMDGFETIAAIRGTLKSDIPVIALTASALKGEREKCLEAGMNDYLAKPFEENSLIRLCARWTNRKIPEKTSRETPPPLPKSFDLSKIRDITGSNHELYRKIIEAFIIQIREALPAMRTAFTHSDSEEIYRIAHSIKPSLMDFKINDLADDILWIEKASKSKPLSDEIQRRIDRMEDRLHLILVELEKELI
jgi:signal transduction histidine kinase/CheY-like chemotaxis protein/HPt (histidine-containing phosphotransfer) domain-containing protein